MAQALYLTTKPKGWCNGNAPDLHSGSNDPTNRRYAVWLTDNVVRKDKKKTSKKKRKLNMYKQTAGGREAVG
jgi:hypothetical protein